MPPPTLEHHVLARVDGLREVADHLGVHLADLEVGLAESRHDIVAQEALDGVSTSTTKTVLLEHLPCLVHLVWASTSWCWFDLKDGEVVVVLVDDVDEELIDFE